MRVYSAAAEQTFDLFEDRTWLSEQTGVAEGTLRTHYGRFIHVSESDALELSKIDSEGLGYPRVAPLLPHTGGPEREIARNFPIGLIVGGGAKIYREASGQNSLGARAKETADEIAGQLKVRFQERGWLTTQPTEEEAELTWKSVGSGVGAARK